MGDLLRKEVETPEHRQTGIGIMLVASACMFFAVATSAFLLRAQVQAPCQVIRAHSLPAPMLPAAAPLPDDCGRAVFESVEGGAVYFTAKLCPGATHAMRPETTAPAAAGHQH